MKVSIGRFVGDVCISEEEYGFKVPADGYVLRFEKKGDRRYEVFEENEKVARFVCSGKHLSVTSITGDNIMIVNEAGLEKADDAMCCGVVALMLARRNEK